MNQHCAENRNADGRRELRHRIEHRRCHAAFVLWKPITGRLRRPWEGWSFSNSQQNARAKQALYAERRGGRKRRRCPNDRADNSNPSNAEAVEQQTARNLQRRVRPVVRAGQKSKQHRGHAKRVVQRFFGNGEIYAVKITDENSEAEQRGNSPSPPRHNLVLYCFAGIQEADSLNHLAPLLSPHRPNYLLAAIPTEVCPGGICLGLSRRYG